MFSDPQTVTVNSVAQTLARVGIGENRGVFRKDDATYELQFTQTIGRRARRSVRLTHNKVVPDSLNPALNVPVSASFTLVCDVPLLGFSLAELGYDVDGLHDYLGASSNAALTKLLGGEL